MFQLEQYSAALVFPIGRSSCASMCIKKIIFLIFLVDGFDLRRS